MKNILYLCLFLSCTCQAQEFLRFSNGDSCGELVEVINSSFTAEEASFEHEGIVTSLYKANARAGEITFLINCRNDSILSLSVNLNLQTESEAVGTLELWRKEIESALGAATIDYRDFPKELLSAEERDLLPDLYWRFDERRFAYLSVDGQENEWTLRWSVDGER